MDLLLVEDDQSLGYILKEYLELHGFAVSQAKDGEEGWRLFGRKSYQLCILDIMLPKKDGFTLAKEIRNQDADVPIIFLTSRALKVDKLKGFRIGADDYLVKPVDEEELIARIKAILKRSQLTSIRKEPVQRAQYQIGQFLFDVKNQRLHFQDKFQSLTRKEATFFQSETIDMFSSFVIILCISFVVSVVRLSQKRQVNELKLQGMLTESNLNLLKSQMHPHFIFNTLNTVSGWMDKDVDKAQELLENLSHLLRSSLRQSKQQDISLREEISFLKKYIEIEQARFSKIMEVNWDICERCDEAAIPHMILQPLVENTIQHGFQGIKKTGVLCMSASKQDNQLIISIQDNGLGITLPVIKGIGLELVEKRLSALYGDQASLVFQQEESGGTSVILRLPFRRYASYSVS